MSSSVQGNGSVKVMSEGMGGMLISPSVSPRKGYGNGWGAGGEQKRTAGESSGLSAQLSGPIYDWGSVLEPRRASVLFGEQ